MKDIVKQPSRKRGSGMLACALLLGLVGVVVLLAFRGRQGWSSDITNPFSSAQAVQNGVVSGLSNVAKQAVIPFRSLLGLH